MKKLFMWCIACDEWVQGYDYEFHEYASYFYPDTPELEGCTGPFTSCPPPITDDRYWEWLFLQEPDEEFMKISNRSLMY